MLFIFNYIKKTLFTFSSRTCTDYYFIMLFCNVYGFFSYNFSSCICFVFWGPYGRLTCVRACVCRQASNYLGAHLYWFNRAPNCPTLVSLWLVLSYRYLLIASASIFLSPLLYVKLKEDWLSADTHLCHVASNFADVRVYVSVGLLFVR